MNSNPRSAAAPTAIPSVTIGPYTVRFISGGRFRLDGGAMFGVVPPTFPKAHYLVRRQEWDDAHHANERNRASYLSENYDPLAESGQLILHKEDMEILPGVWMKGLPGHTLGHQGVFFDVPGQRA